MPTSICLTSIPDSTCSKSSLEFPSYPTSTPVSVFPVNVGALSIYLSGGLFLCPADSTSTYQSNLLFHLFFPTILSKISCSTRLT